MFLRMVNRAGLAAAHRFPRRYKALVLAGAAAAAVAMAVAGCGASATNAASAKSSTVINAIGAENEYANVLAQIGGKYVHVCAIVSDPNTDPHTFEASPSVARRSAAPSSSSRTESVTTHTSKRSSRRPRTRRAR